MINNQRYPLEDQEKGTDLSWVRQRVGTTALNASDLVYVSSISVSGRLLIWQGDSEHTTPPSVHSIERPALAIGRTDRPSDIYNIYAHQTSGETPAGFTTV